MDGVKGLAGAFLLSSARLFWRKRDNIFFFFFGVKKEGFWSFLRLDVVGDNKFNSIGSGTISVFNFEYK